MQDNLRTVNVGLIGLGTVGGGVARTILSHHDRYLDAYNIDLKIARACGLVWEQAGAAGITPEQFTSDWHDVVSDESVDIVVELIGGEHPATEIYEAAFAAGKHVVTANKALLGRHVESFARAAREHGVQLKCEASCGGGIPIVSTLERDLVGNEILTIAGILNGTTNYILTQMIHNGVTFEDALRQAQVNGYAEKDPTADIEGHDACRKICILSDLAYGDKFDPDAVSCEGITKITLEDVANADKLGCVIKLLGRSVRCEDGTAYAYVAPHLIHKESPLAAVEDVFNAIMVDGNATGEVMFYGKGAGKLATASAVVADMLDSIEHRDSRRRIMWGDGSKKLLRPLDTLRSAWYVRFKGAREDIESILPVESLSEPVEGVFVVQTSKIPTAEMDAAAEKLNAVGKVCAAMRIL